MKRLVERFKETLKRLVKVTRTYLNLMRSKLVQVMRPIIDVEYDSEGFGRQVLGGFSLRRLDEGIGFILDVIGRRFYVSWRHDGNYWQRRKYYFRWVRFDHRPGLSDVWIFFGPLHITIARAYGGFLMRRDDTDKSHGYFMKGSSLYETIEEVR